jgi:hypothetical protein
LRATNGEKEILVKIATIGVTTLAVWLVANPAAAIIFGKDPFPYWLDSATGWATVNKWVTTAWPEPPRMPTKVTRELRLVPPKVYDHPYVGPGVLRVIYAKSQDEVRQLCPRTLFPKAGAYGCAPTNSEGCVVVVAPEADIKAVGLWMSLVIRHETAHCNGWPGDHPGALPVEDWAIFDNSEDVPNKPLQPPTAQQPASRPCGLAIQKPCE